MGLFSSIRRLFSSIMASVPHSGTVITEQGSKHLLFNSRCDGCTITADVLLNDTRQYPAMLGHIAVTKVQRCKYPDNVEHEVVVSEVARLDDARKPIDYAVVSFERYIRSVEGQPVDEHNLKPSLTKRRPKTSADVRASSSDFSFGSGENSAFDALRSYHRKTFASPEGRPLTIMSEMIFPIDGESIFFIEELATMAKVLSASAPIYNLATTNCYWYASTLMEMVSKEKVEMFKLKIHETAQKPGTVRGRDVNFEPHPSQKVSALRIQHTKSWKQYREDIRTAREQELRRDQERDRPLRQTEEALWQSQRETERERVEKEAALRRAEAAEAKLALMTSGQTL